jgi:hypothetical protein
MGMDALRELGRDKRTPEQKRWGRIKTTFWTIVIGGSLAFVLVAGVVQIVHWIHG